MSKKAKQNPDGIRTWTSGKSCVTTFWCHNVLVATMNVHVGSTWTFTEPEIVVNTFMNVFTTISGSVNVHVDPT